MKNSKISSFYYFALKVVRVFISFLTLAISAKYFGVSIDRDVWILTSTFILTVNLALWGPINETFRAKFVFIKESVDEKYALETAGALVSFIFLLTVLFSIIILFFASDFVTVIAPSLNSNNKFLFFNMLYILIPILLINELTCVCTSILNAYNSFYIPEVVALFTSIIGIIVLFFLAPIVGIFSLFISQYISVIVLLIVLILYMKKYKIDIFSYIFTLNYSIIKPYILFSIPFFLPYFAGQCSAILEKSLSNTLGEGVVSLIDYSSKYTIQLQGVLTSLLSSIMVPLLSKKYAQNSIDEFSFVLRDNLNFLLIVLALIVPYIFGASFMINNILYYRGVMTIVEIEKISWLTRAYAISFIPTMLYVFLGLSLLSSNKGKYYAGYGFFSQILFMIISLVFLKRIGVFTFATANFISTTLAVVFLYRKNKKFNLLNNFHFVFRYFLLIFCVSVLFYFISNVFQFYFSIFIALIISSISYVILFLLCSEILGFNFFSIIKNRGVELLFRKKTQ